MRQPCCNPHLLIYLCQANFSVSVCCRQCIRQIDAKPGNPVFQYHQLQIALCLASQAGIYGFAHSGVGTSIYVVLKTYSGYPWGLCTLYIFHSDGFQALCHLSICHCRNATEPYCQYPLQTVFSLVFHPILQSLIPLLVQQPAFIPYSSRYAVEFSGKHMDGEMLP